MATGGRDPSEDESIGFIESFVDSPEDKAICSAVQELRLETE